MKNVFKKVLPLAISALSIAAACSGCGGEGNGYVPSDSSNYFYIDDVCRVLTLDESKTEEQKSVPLLDFVIYKKTDFDELKTTLEHAQYYSDKNCVFFKSRNVLNKKGVEEVYECLGIDNYNLLDTEKWIDWSGFYSYNQTVDYKAEYIKVSVDANIDSYCIGELVDFDVYTFNYIDYSSEGEEVARGEFQVYLNTFNSLGVFDNNRSGNK